MRAARPKISEIFGRAVPASGAVFRVTYLSLAVGTAAGSSAEPRDGEPKSFRIYSLAVSVHEDVCAPRAAAQIAKERCMRRQDRARCGGRATKNLSRFSNQFSLFGCLHGSSVERLDNVGGDLKSFRICRVVAFVTCGVVY